MSASLTILAVSVVPEAHSAFHEGPAYVLFAADAGEAIALLRCVRFDVIIAAPDQPLLVALEEAAALIQPGVRVHPLASDALDLDECGATSNEGWKGPESP